MEIKIASSDADIARCFPVMAQLRANVTADTFVARIRDLQRGGYELAYLEEGAQIRALAGFRIANMLARGRHIYVDDLVTDEGTRSRGYGATLLKWLVDLARSRGCQRLDLDSAVQRQAAHRFYFREGMHIASYHFTRSL